jgi:hypothetical protein
MTDPVPLPATGPRVLGFGKHAEIAAQIQDNQRRLGIRSTNFALTDDENGDARLVAELEADDYDAVVIGAFINGQDPDNPPTSERTAWFNRVLNIIHARAPRARIVLVRGPSDVMQALERELGST